jgi:hypothetical protein
MKVVNLPDRLAFPEPGTVSRLSIAAKSNEMLLRSATVSNDLSLARMFTRCGVTPASVFDELSGLDDDLASHTPERNLVSVLDYSRRRVESEFALYNSVRAAPRRDYADPSQFVFDMVEVNRALHNGGGVFRTKGMEIAAPEMNSTTRFPHPKMTPALIDRLALFISHNLDLWPAVCAMAAYAGVIHAHPFPDGNGRTGRMMYNLVLLSAGVEHFVPISLVSAVTGNNFVLKIRRALLGGDWESLQRYFHDAAKLSQLWQAESEMAS